jgi:DNA-binding HxlR family transcriptional regulator
MADFRYPQFCPLARAAEVVAERWTLPILRELLVGPQRFADLVRRLPGLSSSVLATRLGKLARAGVVAQRTLPPPGTATVYELTGAGRALEPAILELARFGLRYLDAPAKGDHFEADWLPFGLRTFARREATPRRAFELLVPRDDAPPVRIRVEGGPRGTRVERLDAPPGGEAKRAAARSPDGRLAGPPLLLLGVASGRLDGPALVAEGRLRYSGDRGALRELPILFEPRSPQTP